MQHKRARHDHHPPQQWRASRLLSPRQACNEAGRAHPPDALWIDLIEPTPQEDRLVESYLGICMPTREEMSDIEPSELLYTEDGARYMTARVIHNVESTPK